MARRFFGTSLEFWGDHARMPKIMNFNRALVIAAILISLNTELSLSAEESLPTDVRGLPRPAGMKTVVEIPETAVFLISTSVPDATAQVKKLYADQGWEPYGFSGETLYFKKGRAKALVTISPAVREIGQTNISLNLERMNADLPAPPDATEVQFSPSTKTLGFTWTKSPMEIAEFFRQKLASQGWTTTMTEPKKADFNEVIIFQHPSEGMIRVEMTPSEGSVRTAAKYSTAAEVAAEKAQAAAFGDKLRAKLAADAVLAKVTIPLPSDVAGHAILKGTLRFNVPAGRAKAALELIQKSLEAEGWTLQAGPPMPNEGGGVTFTKGANSILVNYMDPGFMPAELSVMPSGVELESSGGSQ